MAEITWTAEAQQWLEDIFEYIAQDNPQAAARTVHGIYERAQDLIQFPQLGSATRLRRAFETDAVQRCAVHGAAQRDC